MITKLTARERIEKVVCWAGLNTSTFATHIGLSSPQTLYQIKVGKHGISRSTAERTCNHYPEIDFAWLLTGEGEMLRPQEASIPYYTLDCREVALGNNPTLPSGRITMVGCGDCAFVAPLQLPRDGARNWTREPALLQRGGGGGVAGWRPLSALYGARSDGWQGE